MKLSIITVNLNNAEGLRKTIESVVTQTFTDYEYIIIDGGSTDRSVDIIKHYADKIAYWVSEPDKGIYNAMNKGILQAKGEYCLFLNSGDYLFAENTLELCFNEVEENYDIIYGNVISTDRTGKIKTWIAPQPEEFTAISFNYITLFHPSSFIKKNIFDICGLYDDKYKIVSDWKLWLITIIKNHVSIKKIDIPVAYFEKNGISSDRIILNNERKAVYEELFHPVELRDMEKLISYYSLETVRKNKITWFFYKILYRIANKLNSKIKNDILVK